MLCRSRSRFGIRTATGWRRWLRGLEVTRVGLEASGGYERGLATALWAAGFEVVVQPTEIRAFARFKRIRAKNDKLDARVIAMATAQVEAKGAQRVEANLEDEQKGDGGEQGQAEGDNHRLHFFVPNSVI